MNNEKHTVTAKAFLKKLLIYLCIFAVLSYLGMIREEEQAPIGESENAQFIETVDPLLEYSGSAYIAINNNVPGFEEEEITMEAFEIFSPLDDLGRCGIAYANICQELMPTEDRGDISAIKPSGWHSVRYEFVDGKSLYNRCHLIGFQLSGENANKLNLITGTRYLNVEGMLPFENMIADFVKETGYHVLYRVTPIYFRDELVARGVQLEALSVEDYGEGISFNVYCFNVQPGVEIDYASGVSWIEGETGPDEVAEYVLNEGSKKFHLPSCTGAESISQKNKRSFTGSHNELIEMGYTPCGTCNP